MSESLPGTKSRFRGCLLGGAVGDALGYPIEFIHEEEIFKKFGKNGIEHLSQAGSPALISDDTQMTLFTANGILYGLTNSGKADTQYVFTAYCEWLNTQGTFRHWDDNKKNKMWLRQVPELNDQRAPGLTCLQALRTSRFGGSVEEPINDRKGCGGVMRVAPIGLFCGESNCAELAAEAAALTHGHPLGWLSAAVLAQIVHDIVHDSAVTLTETVIKSASKVSALYPEAEEIEGYIQHVSDLAHNSEISDLTGLHRCGEGWVGDEALYIGIYCALRYENDFAAAIRLAVNHDGDSDSTGSICGNILGAWLGEEAVSSAFELDRLELYGVIREIADDMHRAYCEGIPKNDPQWQRKYVSGEH